MVSSLFAKMLARNLLYYQSPEAVWSTGVKELLGRAGFHFFCSVKRFVGQMNILKKIPCKLLFNSWGVKRLII